MKIPSPFFIKNGIVVANLNISHSLKTLSELIIPFRYPKKNGLKSRVASQIIDLRFQFQPYCLYYHEHKDFNLIINDVIGVYEGSTSKQDFIYLWQFAHRHGFPTNLNGYGRGEGARIRDIKNHPLSYILLCEEAHEEYDRETGEWKSNKLRL